MKRKLLKKTSEKLRLFEVFADSFSRNSLTSFAFLLIFLSGVVFVYNEQFTTYTFSAPPGHLITQKESDFINSHNIVSEREMRLRKAAYEGYMTAGFVCVLGILAAHDRTRKRIDDFLTKELFKKKKKIVSTR